MYVNVKVLKLSVKTPLAALFIGTVISEIHSLFRQIILLAVQLCHVSFDLEMPQMFFQSTLGLPISGRYQHV